MKTFIHVSVPPLPTIKVTNPPNGKRFYTTPAGNKYVSITTLLGDKEKPWLANWRASLGPVKADKETKRASERGDNIHKLIELYLSNQLTYNITKSYKPEYISGFNQIKLRLNKINNIHAQETALYSDLLRTAGRVDCIGEYENKLSIIDFKTSTNAKSISMIQDYYLQCTAYAIMWNELTGQTINDIAIIMAGEKTIAPLLFKGHVEDYIEPLVQRIAEYYSKLPTN
jgi:genome maintenance exonuclease 1